jgi:hypothetical protein
MNSAYLRVLGALDIPQTSNCMGTFSSLFLEPSQGLSCARAEVSSPWKGGQKWVAILQHFPMDTRHMPGTGEIQRDPRRKGVPDAAGGTKAFASH